jgi:hypothetical protein
MRQKHERALEIRLECGHIVKKDTGRYRVSVDLRCLQYNEHVRRGVWCPDCDANMQPVELLGVTRL